METVNMTISIPKQLKSRMDALPEVNWSAVARKAFDEKTSILELLNKFTANSMLTEEDALRLGRDLRHKIARQRYKNSN